MKKTLPLLLSILLAVALSACAQPANPPPEPISTAEPEPALEPTPEPTPTEPESIIEPEIETPAANATPSAELAQEWDSFQVELNGKLYQLPAPFAEFAADGWGFDDESLTLAPDTYSLEQMKNGKQTIYARIINLDVNVLPFNECYIGSLALDEWDAERGGATLFVPGGISLGASMDDVRAAYGEPSSSSEGETFINWKYELKSYADLNVTFNSETKDVNKLDIRNYFPAEPITPSTSTSNSEVPASVLNYKAPTELGSNWDSYNVRFDGDLYTMPAPVSVFVANGWKIVDDNVTVSARSAKIGFTISKNNKSMRTNLYNYSDTAQPAENCFVTKVISGIYSGVDLPIELPGGITRDSTAEDIVKAYGEPDKISDSTTFELYYYGKVFECLSFSISHDTGKSQTIELEYSSKNLDY